MFTMHKLLKGFLNALNSAAAPWQIALAAALGTLLGFMPIWNGGPSLLPLIVLFVAIVVNCHFATVLVFWGTAKLLSFAIAPVALALGNACDGLAQTSSGIGLLHASGWSHTGWLGLALVGLVLAPVAAYAAARLTRWFRKNLRDRIAEQRRKVEAKQFDHADPWLNLACWFFDL